VCQKLVLKLVAIRDSCVASNLPTSLRSSRLLNPDAAHRTGDRLEAYYLLMKTISFAITFPESSNKAPFAIHLNKANCC